jgi:hypothetical protein
MVHEREYIWGAIKGLLVASLLALPLIAINTVTQDRILKNEAINAGVAKYVVSKYGKVSFKWEDCDGQ